MGGQVSAEAPCPKESCGPGPGAGGSHFPVNQVPGGKWSWLGAKAGGGVGGLPLPRGQRVPFWKLGPQASASLPSWHFFFFWLFRAALVTYASSQTRGQMGSVAAGLQHSHSHAGSEPCLRPTPCSRQCQIPDQGARLGIEPESSWTLVGFVSTAPQQELPVLALCKRRNRFPELPRRGSSLGCFKTSL